MAGHQPDRLEALERELTEVRAQQRATVEVLHAIGHSAFDLRAVFETVLENAVSLCRADGGQIFRSDGDAYRVVCHAGSTSEHAKLLSGMVLRPGKESVVGKVALEHRTVQVRDVLVDPDYGLRESQRIARFRTVLGVPIMGGGEPIGVIILFRRAVDPFTKGQIDLVSTFAAQGAIAIEHVELFGEIERKSRELEVVSRHKSEFLAQMSHELRTPLNAIIGFSGVLLERTFGDVNAKQEEYLADILGAGRHLLSLINDVLDVAKVEAGQMNLELSDVDLGALLDDALVLVREQASDRAQTIELNVEPELPRVYADGRRIKQVVANLVSNAVKFTPEQGRIVTTARLVGDAVHVSVADNGIGIGPDDREMIFEAFNQVTAGPEPKPEGTGLGLTLSRQIVGLHGGSLWVESSAGEGSTFTFSLPMRGAVPVRTPSAPEPTAAAVDPATIVLLVEDDEHSVELLSLYLRDAGFEITVASNGAEGLELARRLRPAGIILDILLPGLDGWQFLARAKAEPELATIPVIIVSMLDERGRGLALGAADYLVKPIAREDLLDALARVAAVPHATALAIDDDPVALELISAVLEPAGFTVLSAHNGRDGLALAEAEEPDVILLDLLMPQVDGFMVVEQLQANPTTSSIPIVVLTSKTVTIEDERRLRGRIASIARKGEVDRAALLALVRKFTPARTS